jgi:ProP effector
MTENESGPPGGNRQTAKTGVQITPFLADQIPQDKKFSKTALYYAKVEATIAMLAARFPKAFSVYETRRKPLKIGIDADIIARTPDILLADLIAALRCYVVNAGYLARSVEGAPRIDLDGNPVGTITPDQARNASIRHAAILRKRYARKVSKRAEAQAKAPPPKRLDGLAKLKAAARARRNAASRVSP